MASATVVSSSKCYEGFQKVYCHYSEEVKCKMNFSIYIPPQAKDEKCPVLFWLSGLTCSEKNFIEKSGFQRHAAHHGIIVVGPDTSPRDCNIDGEADNWSFGVGAGFYLDATQPKWRNNYRMYSYVTQELPSLIMKEFPANGRMSISGHSMGGHGAITCALKNPKTYISVSAFAPICNPTITPWGKVALQGYLGENNWDEWKHYDSTLLAKDYKGSDMEILIHQGAEDPYLNEELKPEKFIEACKGTNIKPILKMKEGYDHSYYFVATFLGDHFNYHAKFLCQ